MKSITEGCDKLDTCRYFRNAVFNEKEKQKGNWIDLTVLLATYLILWIFPEKNLFPVGLMMYAVSCGAGIIKFSYNGRFNKILKIFYCLSLLPLTAFVLLGVTQAAQISIIDGCFVVVLSKSMASLIKMGHFETVVMLYFSGIPLFFMFLRITIGGGNAVTIMPPVSQPIVGKV